VAIVFARMAFARTPSRAHDLTKALNEGGDSSKSRAEENSPASSLDRLKDAALRGGAAGLTGAAVRFVMGFCMLLILQEYKPLPFRSFRASVQEWEESRSI
jgi:hypothetical protein